jgi:alpha-glucosidase (family GH31 glycosyl hydrolase)
MQFGIPPWYFDEETNSICKKFVDLHESKIFPYIYELPLDGQPIIRPVWWLEPENNLIYQINDQFVVGDDILVAPVLDPEIKHRNIYFPRGNI